MWRTTTGSRVMVAGRLTAVAWLLAGLAGFAGWLLSTHEGTVARAAEARQQGVDGKPLPEVRFFLGGATGRPGETVTLEMGVLTNSRIRALSMAVDFDETRLRVLAVRKAERPTDAEVSSINFDNRDEEVGDQSVEGWLYVRLGRSEGSLDIPLDERTTLFELDIAILRDARLGGSTLRFSDIGPVVVVDEPVFLDNSVVLDLEGLGVEMNLADDNLDGGEVEIIGEVGFFVRGDVDLNCKHEITDALITLTYLFLDGSEPDCLDAADANDSGSLDISDPIFMLDWMFTGGQDFSEPFHRTGSDPTADGLDCVDGLEGPDSCGSKS